jgi:hypothetical protein
MPTGNHIRHIITLLLILTLANLAASFAALHAVRAVRDDSRAHIERIDTAIGQLTSVTTQLCMQRPGACVPQQDASVKLR